MSGVHPLSTGIQPGAQRRLQQQLLLGKIGLLWTAMTAAAATAATAIAAAAIAAGPMGHDSDRVLHHPCMCRLLLLLLVLLLLSLLQLPLLQCHQQGA
jgi:hypothetical protein